MKVVITGAKAIGSHLAKLLSRGSEDVTLIDEDGEHLSQLAANYDILTVQSSPCSLRTMKDVGVDKADLFIAVTANENQNVQACIMAKALGAKKTVAKVDTKEYIEEEFSEFYERLGLSSIIYPELLAARDIVNGLKMSWVRQRWDVHDGALVMLGIKLRSECTILSRPLRDLCGPDDPYHVVAIKRHNETIIPVGSDELQSDDLAYFMTTRQYIPYIRKIVGKEHYADVKNVMIMGGGKTAVRTVKAMPDYMNVKIIESDERRCEELNELLGSKCLVINGDGRDLSLLSEESITNTQAFVALTGNAESNILACLSAKRYGVRKTVAVVENLDYAAMAESLDIGTIINKKSIAASYIYQMMLDADVTNVRFLTNANADVAEFVAAEGSNVTKKPVKELDIPRGVTFGGLVRDGEGMLVSGNTQIKAGDIVVVFIHGTNIKKAERLFV
jgi:trk system potassium uptake protein